jgi:hypothetical protein
MVRELLPMVSQSIDFEFFGICERDSREAPAILGSVFSTMLFGLSRLTTGRSMTVGSKETLTQKTWGGYKDAINA